MVTPTAGYTHEVRAVFPHVVAAYFLTDTFALQVASDCMRAYALQPVAHDAWEQTAQRDAALYDALVQGQEHPERFPSYDARFFIMLYMMIDARVDVAARRADDVRKVDEQVARRAAANGRDPRLMRPQRAS